MASSAYKNKTGLPFLFSFCLTFFNKLSENVGPRRCGGDVLLYSCSRPPSGASASVSFALNGGRIQHRMSKKGGKLSRTLVLKMELYLLPEGVVCFPFDLYRSSNVKKYFIPV